MEAPNSGEVLTGAGLLIGLIAAVTAFFKFGLPALRNGQHDRDTAEALKDLRVALEELHDAMDKLPTEVVNGVRAAFADSVARIDMQAREREIARIEAAAKRRA